MEIYLVMEYIPGDYETEVLYVGLDLEESIRIYMQDKEYREVQVWIDGVMSRTHEVT